MRKPTAYSPAPVAAARPSGQANWYARLAGLDLRHASSGPTPVRNSSARPIGTIHVLKNGGPTVIRWPVTASLSVGNSVANRMKKAENSSIQLFSRNAASRDIHDSSSLRARSSGSR